MRKSEKEIENLEMIEAIINKAQVCRIGMYDGETSYVVPMNFGYRDKTVYLHSAPEGRKVELMKKSNRVCFEVDVDHELAASDHSCGFSMKYRSVIGFGTAHLIDDQDEKRRGLDTIMEHYGEKEPHVYREKNLSRALVIRIDIEEITGKANGY